MAGSYLVLDGHCGLAFAVQPEIEVTLKKAAVNQLDSLTIAVIETVGLGRSIEVSVFLSEDLSGWGLGTSAAYAVALTGAACAEAGLPCDPAFVFPLAYKAHKKWQQGLGSGIDVAACCYGGVIAYCGSKVETLTWPSDLALVLVKTGIKADTRTMIEQWRSLPAFYVAPQKRRVVETCNELISCLRKGKEIKTLLAELGEAEKELAFATGIPIVTELQKELERVLTGVVVKSLGAGGGDSVGVFVESERAHHIIAYIRALGLEARLVKLTGGLEVFGITSADRPRP